MGNIRKTTQYIDWLGEERPFFGNFIAATSEIPPTPTPTPSNTPIPPSPSVTATVTVTPTHTTTPTPTPTLPAGITAAWNYLEEVVQAGGTVDATTSAATVTFFTGLYSNSLWEKIYAFYPLIGGNSSSAQAIEGKLTYNISSWNGGFTFSTHGVQGNGVNNYAVLPFSPDSLFGDTRPSSIGVFVNLEGTVGNRVYDIGANEPTLNGQSNLTVRRAAGSTDETLFDAGDYNAFTTASGRVNTTTANSSGSTIGSAVGASHRELYKNGASVATKTVTGNLSYTSNPMYFTAQNEGGTANWFNSNRYGFMFVGSGLTDSEVTVVSDLINDYQKAIGRYFY